MLTDTRINPDNKLSGYIRIINYPFNYPSINMAADSFHLLVV